MNTVHGPRRYLNIVFDTRASAEAERLDLLKPYPANSLWRKRIIVGPWPNPIPTRASADQLLRFIVDLSDLGWKPRDIAVAINGDGHRLEGGDRFLPKDISRALTSMCVLTIAQPG